MTSILQICLGLVCASAILVFMWQIAIRASKYMIRHAEAPPGLPLLEDEPSGVKISVPLFNNHVTQAWHRGSGQEVLIVPDAGFAVSAYTPIWSMLCGYGFRVAIFRPRSIHQITDPETHLQDLQAVIRQLNMRKPILVGHGFGAYLCLLHQQQHTSQMMRTPAAGVLAISPFSGLGMKSIPGKGRIDQVFQKTIRYQKGLSAFGEGASAAGILALQQHTDYFPWEYLSQNWPLIRPDRTLSQDCRFRLLAPATDGIIPFPHLEQVQAAFPEAILSRVNDGAGHMLIWEKPSQVVEEVRILGKALRTTSVAAS